MGAFQTKLINHIKTECKSISVDSDLEFRFANCGTIYFRDGFTLLGRIQFHFDDDSFDFTLLKKETDTQIHNGENKNWYLVGYNSNSEVSSAINTLNEFIKQLKPNVLAVNSL